LLYCRDTSVLLHGRNDLPPSAKLHQTDLVTSIVRCEFPKRITRGLLYAGVSSALLHGRDDLSPSTFLALRRVFCAAAWP
jgi:hypothetical protein